MLHRSILATFFSIKSNIRPGVAMIIWTAKTTFILKINLFQKYFEVQIQIYKKSHIQIIENN